MNQKLTIYAAGAIDLGTDMPDWRTSLNTMLNQCGITAVIFDPSTAFKSSTLGEVDLGRSQYIEDVNRCALESANVFVACVSQHTPSVGTPIEIEFARQSGKDRYVVTDIPRGKSMYLDNRFDESQWIFVKDFETADHATAGLFKLSDKLIKLTSRGV